MLDLFTMVWGKMAQTYLDMTLHCILQDIPAITKDIHSYTLYTSDEAKQTITSSVLYKKLAELVTIRWKPLMAGEWNTTANILEQMKFSAKNKNYMVVIDPDYAVRGLNNLPKIADGKNNPIMYSNNKANINAYPVIKSLMDKHDGKISSRQLVSIAMKFNGPNHYEIIKREGQCWVVSMYTFTIILIPDETIIKLFSTNPSRGSGYDHIVPYFMVKKGYPYYIINDSDIYNVVEVEFGPRIMKEGAGTWHPELFKESKKFMHQFKITWRGEE